MRLAALAVEAAVIAEATAKWVKKEAEDTGLPDDRAEELALHRGQDLAVIEFLISSLNRIEGIAQPHIPWRLYLTPRLDRYVDFHRSSLLAYRRESRAERQDACTVWLRMFEEGGRLPIPYRVVHETTLGPSFATWLGGQVVDDYAGRDRRPARHGVTRPAGLSKRIQTRDRQGVPRHLTGRS